MIDYFKPGCNYFCWLPREFQTKYAFQAIGNKIIKDHLINSHAPNREKLQKQLIRNPRK